MMLAKRKKQRKRSTKMTLIIIPEPLGKPLSLHLSRKKLYAMAAALGVLVVGFLLVFCSYHYHRTEIARVKEYKKEIVQQKETIETLKVEVGEIEKQQAYVGERQREIKKLIGLDNSLDSYKSPTRGADREAENIIPLTEKEVQKATQNIKGELDLLQEELRGLKPLVAANISYYRSLPNQWPIRGEITSFYGWRRSPFGGRKQTFHDGVDIANNAGEKIVSAGDGVVIFAGWQGAYGNTIVIDHGYGIKTKYGHNSRLLVKVGDEVRKGEEVALLGNSGLSTGPHLHFTVYQDDQTLDPLTYLYYQDEK